MSGGEVAGHQSVRSESRCCRFVSKGGWEGEREEKGERWCVVVCVCV